MSDAADICRELRSRLENEFSMPFEVSSAETDGEEHFICVPANEGRQLFSVNASVHNRIRLVVMTSPQDYAGNMLIALAGADEFKRRCFREYGRYLRDHGFRLQLQVDGTEIQETPVWPEKWRGFSFRMTKSPLPESDPSLVMTDFLEEGMKAAVTLMLTLLDVTDTGDGLPENLPGNEGEKSLVVSARYERNPVNRALCLSRKGYVCSVCGFDFGRVYGKIGRNYIEVHHVTPVSRMGPDYHFDVDRDLVPVCSNCHSMLHRRDPPYTVSELQALIAENSRTGAVRTADDISGNEEIMSFMDSVMHDTPDITMMQLLSRVIDRFKTLFPDMSTGNWHYAVGKYYNRVTAGGDKA